MMFALLLLVILASTFNVSTYALEMVDIITLDKKPESITVNEKINLVYVGVEGGIIVMDGETEEIVTEIPLNGTPRRLVVNPLTNRIFASTDGCLYVIDGANNQVVTSSKDAAGFRAYNPVTNLVYDAGIAWFIGDYDVVNVYDGETLRLKTSIRIPNSNEPGPIARLGIAVNPETNRIYVGWSINGTILVIDGNTHEIEKTAELHAAVEILACNPFNNRIYLLDGDIVLDGETLKRVELPWRGRILAIKFTASYSILYTSRGYDVSVLDGDTHDVLFSSTLDEYINQLAVNSITGKIYVSHYDARKISVVQGPIVPEFKSSLILAFFMLATLLAVVVYKKHCSRALKN